MAAPKGNRFWQARTKHGRGKLFSTPEILWEASVEYFEWCEDNPLTEEKIFHTNTVITKDEVSLMRAMTVDGLCIFLDIDKRTYNDYQNREDFIPVTSKIDAVIRNQKFTGAAAGLLNANIIARDLGLKDASEVELTGKDRGPVEVANLSPKEAAKIYAQRIKGEK